MRGFKITIFGMITVSLNVRIANVHVFTAILVSLYNTNHSSEHCVFFWGGGGGGGGAIRSISSLPFQVRGCPYDNVILSTVVFFSA